MINIGRKSLLLLAAAGVFFQQEHKKKGIRSIWISITVRE